MAQGIGQSLAYIASLSKSKRDSEAQIISQLVGQRMSNAYQTARDNAQRAHNVATTEYSDLLQRKEDVQNSIIALENDLKKHNVVIDKYDNSIPDDIKSKDAENLFMIAQRNLKLESDNNNFYKKNIDDKIGTLAEDIKSLENRKLFYSKELETHNQMNRDMSMYAKEIYNEEYDGFNELKKGMDLILTEKELNNYIEKHKEEFDGWVENHNGDEDLVKIKIREAFKGFTASDLKTLNDIEVIRSNKLDNMKKEKDYLTYDPVTQRMVDSFNGRANDLNNKYHSNHDGIIVPDLHNEILEEHPWLTLLNDDGLLVTDNGIPIPSSISTSMTNQNKAISHLISYFNDKMGGKVKYTDDPLLFAKYYLGDIRLRTEDDDVVMFSKEDGYPESWENWIPETDERLKVEHSKRAISELGGIGKLFDGLSSEEELAVQHSLGQFLRRFVESTETYGEILIAEQEYSNAFPSQSNIGSYTAHIFYHPAKNRYSNMISKDEIISDSNTVSADIKNKKEMVFKDFKLSNESALVELASANGYEDVDEFVNDYSNSKDKSKFLSAFSQDFSNLTTANLVKSLNKTIKVIDEEEMKFLNQGGDITRQHQAGELYKKFGERGVNASTLSWTALSMYKELENRQSSLSTELENLPVETIGVSGFGGSVQRNIASHRYRESLKKDINIISDTLSEYANDIEVSDLKRYDKDSEYMQSYNQYFQQVFKSPNAKSAPTQPSKNNQQDSNLLNNLFTAVMRQENSIEDTNPYGINMPRKEERKKKFISQYGAKVRDDSKTLISFKDAVTGKKVGEDIIRNIWKYADGDVAKFYSDYSGLDIDSDEVKSFVEIFQSLQPSGLATI